MQTPKDADGPPDEVRSPEVVSAVLGETPGEVPRPSPLPASVASGEREGPIASAMGG
jgi:hypothetical protein